MGIFSRPITFHSASNGHAETFDGLVDTGAMFTVAPASVLRRMGVKPLQTIPVRFADGRTEQWQLGQVEAQLQGKKLPILCFFGPENTPVLIGAHTLEAFLFMVDPIEKKLVPKEALLM